MRPEERDAAYLWDMRESAKAIESFVAGREFEEFLSEPLLQPAVLRQLTIIGEAAARVSPDLRQQTDHLPWRAAIGLRNLIVHAYNRIVPSAIWKIATVDVPELRRHLDALIPPLPDDQS